MSELLETPRKSPFTTARPTLGVVGLLVFVAVIGMPISASAYLGPIAVHPVGAPVSSVPLGPTGPGLHISPALLNSPIGERNRAFLEAAVSPHGVAPLLQTLLTQTAAPAGAVTHAAAKPDYSGGVNNYIQASDCQGWGTIQGANGQYIPTIAGSSIAQVGSSNQTLVAGGGGLYSVFNVSGGVACTSGIVEPAVLLNGYSNIFTSSNGGASWINITTPANLTHWQNPSDVENGSISTGNNIVAAAPNGLALELTGYAPACISIPVAITCGSTLGLAAPWGYGVSRSTDGGATWGQVAQISSDSAFSYVTFPSSCNISPNPDLLANNIPEHPSLATNGTYAVVTWDILHVIWDPANCTSSGLQATVQSSYSLDGGATWSAPKNVSGPVSEDATIHYGPAPSYTVYQAFSDVSGANASTTGQIQFQWTKSTDGGKTWTALGATQQIGLHNVNPTCYGCSASPDAIDTEQTANFAVDNWTGSPNSGNLYIVWQDNTTTSPGEVSIAFERSTNGGASWNTAKYLTSASPAVHYVEPAITITPDGTIWVTFYGVGTTTGYYNVYGVLSTDGGNTWSPQFTVSSATSTPSTSLQDIGYYMGGVGTSSGFVPIWSDCRSSACSSGNDVQLYTANLNTLNVSTNATVPVSAQVTTFGATSTYPTPLVTGVPDGTSVTVTVPVTLPYNATYVDSFSGWSGLSSSLNYRTTFTYTGTGALVAGYTPVKAAFISGTLWPNGPGAQVTVDSTPVVLTAFNSTAYQYTVSVPTGQAYYVNASETKYTTQSVHTPVAAGTTTWVNFTLQRQVGFLTGTIVPATANLTLNTTTSENSMINPANGQFTITVPWGWYWLNASETGYTSAVCQGHEVQVLPGVATTCNFNLVGGWIYGSVGPASKTLVIKVDGISVPNTDGVFNVSVQGGYHNLTTTEKGYNLSFFPSIYVTPGHASAVNVTLTNHGWISGFITPSAALKNLLLTVTNGTTGGPETYSPTTGFFNVSVLGGLNWTVTVSSSGYNTSTGKAYVTAGNGTAYDVKLGAAIGGCTTNCPPPDCHLNNSCPVTGGGGGSSFPLVDVLAIVVILVIVAVLAAAMMMRRRGGGGGGSDETNPPGPDDTYQGSNPSELPKLQSDGSMGESNQ